MLTTFTKTTEGDSGWSACGHWSVLGARWSVLDGHWSVLVGCWSVLDGRWSVLDGRWSVLDGRWSVLDGWLVLVGWSIFGAISLPSLSVHSDSETMGISLSESNFPGISNSESEDSSEGKS